MIRSNRKTGMRDIWAVRAHHLHVCEACAHSRRQLLLQRLLVAVRFGEEEPVDALEAAVDLLLPDHLQEEAVKVSPLKSVLDSMPPQACSSADGSRACIWM